MDNPVEKNSKPLGRISITIDQELLDELDWMVAERGYQSRSQAISEMATHQLLEYKHQLGNSVMAGTITLLYDRNTRGLQKKLADLQYQYLTEVISSLHVHLAEDKVMEVILVQGPSHKLQEITNSMMTMKGIISGKLQLMAALIPQLHPITGKE